VASVAPSVVAVVVPVPVAVPPPVAGVAVVAVVPPIVLPVGPVAPVVAPAEPVPRLVALLFVVGIGRALRGRGVRPRRWGRPGSGWRRRGRSGTSRRRRRRGGSGRRRRRRHDEDGARRRRRGGGEGARRRGCVRDRGLRGMRGRRLRRSLDLDRGALLAGDRRRQPHLGTGVGNEPLERQGEADGEREHGKGEKRGRETAPHRIPSVVRAAYPSDGTSPLP
jgi:hypothetical protein